jgi:glycosyltransferase involved in cell wall biosynthesis
VTDTVRIYLDVAAAVHRRAGLGRYAESLTRALVANDPTRFALFYNRGGGKVHPLVGLEELPTRTVRAGYKPWRLAVWLGHLAGLGFDRLLSGAQLYHATEHLLMPLRRVPTVLTVHDLIFRLFPQHHKRLNFWYLNVTMPLYCRRAGAIIAVSEATKRDLMRLYGVEESRITVVREAAAPQFTPPSPDHVERVRIRYGLPDRYVLRVGTIEPRKNLDRLLEVIQQLRKGGEAIPLVIVGSKGWLYQRFFRRLDELALGGLVHLPGYIPDADLPAVYGGATLAAEPSLYEGFGLPVLEAMACGVPVVCSRTSSLPEVGGQAARYFDPSDVSSMAHEILTVWRDAVLRDAMRQAGLARAARFSWERAAQETMTVYEAVLAAPEGL